MESDDLIEAKLPEDLMNGVQASPSEFTVVAPKAKNVARKGTGEAASRSRTAAAVAAAAKPLGGGGGGGASSASRSPQSGLQRRTRGGGGGREASPVKQPDIVVLD